MLVLFIFLSDFIEFVYSLVLGLLISSVYFVKLVN